MIERTHPKLSVGAQCQLLSISRSSFYYAPQWSCRGLVPLL
jgi:putative transposase